jgi:hypothetical protein
VNIHTIADCLVTYTEYSRNEFSDDLNINGSFLDLFNES